MHFLQFSEEIFLQNFENSPASGGGAPYQAGHNLETPKFFPSTPLHVLNKAKQSKARKPSCHLKILWYKIRL